jgi:hypothetical protein
VVLVTDNVIAMLGMGQGRWLHEDRFRRRIDSKSLAGARVVILEHGLIRYEQALLEVPGLDSQRHCQSHQKPTHISNVRSKTHHIAPRFP